MENANSIKDIINDSLQQVRTILNANTVVGEQIRTNNGTVIIPISKVSMGFASGGLDVPAKKGTEKKNFGGGGGTGVTVSPIGFLVVSPEGKVEMLPMTSGPATPVDQIIDLIDQAPTLVSKIKDAFFDEEEEKAEEELQLIDLEQKISAELAEKLMNDEPLTKKEEKELKKLQKEQEAEEKRAAKLAAKQAKKENK